MKVTNSSEEVVKGVEILLAYTVLQTYDDQEDMLEMLEVSSLLTILVESQADPAGCPNCR